MSTAEEVKEDVNEEDVNATIEREEDYQAEQVIESESSVFPCINFDTPEEAEEWLRDYVLKSDWWTNMDYYLEEVNVELLDDSEEGNVLIHRKGTSTTIQVSKHGLREFVILSALASQVIPPDKAAQGKEYAGTMLAMAEQFLGDDTYEELINAYEENEVEYEIPESNHVAQEEEEDED